MRPLAGDAVELMALRSRIGPMPGLWTTGYAGLAAPLSFQGLARRYVSDVDGGSVTILCIGRHERFERLLPRLFPDMRQIGVEGNLLLWSPRRLAALRADLVAVELHPWMASRFRRAGWAVVPHNLRWRAKASEVPAARPSKSLRANLKRLRELGHELELVRKPTPADLREFRVEMAAPLARKRFGALAWEPSPALFRSMARRCELLFVRLGGERVAGEMILRYRDVAATPLQGVRGGDPGALKAGLQSALYAGFFEYARRSGAATVDLGLTSSFVRDGVAYYKRQWGLAPHPDDMSPLIAVRADMTHLGISSVFAREPLVTLTETGLGRLPG